LIAIAVHKRDLAPFRHSSAYGNKMPQQVELVDGLPKSKNIERDMEGLRNDPPANLGGKCVAVTTNRRIKDQNTA
jgi:hypothetical protein